MRVKYDDPRVGDTVELRDGVAVAFGRRNMPARVVGPANFAQVSRHHISLTRKGKQVVLAVVRSTREVRVVRVAFSRLRDADVTDARGSYPTTVMRP